MSSTRAVEAATEAPDQAAVQEEHVAPSGPARTDLAMISGVVLGASLSPVIMAAMTMPTLAIVLWRTTLATALLGPWTAMRCRPEIRSLSRGAIIGSAGVGVVLALHFATFVPSLTRTSVASAASLVAMQPVWTAVLGRFLGEQLRRGVWVGMAVALAGVLGLTAADATAGGQALVGNALALFSGILGAAYVVAGSRLRQTVSTSVYTLLCYGTCAIVMLVACLVTGTAMGGYSQGEWVKIAALTLTGQLLAHSLTNTVVARVSPTFVSMAGLLSVPLAALIAAAWLRQVPPVMAVPSLIVILFGIALAIRSGGAGGSSR